MLQTFICHRLHSTAFATGTFECVEDIKLMTRFIAQSDFRTFVAFKAPGMEKQGESEGNQTTKLASAAAFNEFTCHVGEVHI
jgi:hypothetical protein